MLWRRKGRHDTPDAAPAKLSVRRITATVVATLMLLVSCRGGEAEPNAMLRLRDVAVTSPAPAGARGPDVAATPTPDNVHEFMTLVGDDLDAFWRGALGESEIRYEAPEYVWVPAGHTTDSNCGRAGRHVGPFYCPGERRDGVVHERDRIYVSAEWMYSEVFVKLPEHDQFAAASVIAHEFSHHVQHLAGMVLGRELDACCGLTARQVELHAECLSGLWARSAYASDQLDEASVTDAMGVVASANDAEKLLPGSPGGELLPEERVESFRQGYDSGSTQSCEQAAVLAAQGR